MPAGVKLEGRSGAVCVIRSSKGRFDRRQQATVRFCGPIQCRKVEFVEPFGAKKVVGENQFQPWKDESRQLFLARFELLFG